MHSPESIARERWASPDSVGVFMARWEDGSFLLRWMRAIGNTRCCIRRTTQSHVRPGVF